MIGMTETITATSDQACDLRIWSPARLEPATYGLQVGCSASAWLAPDESGLLTLDASSVQTAPDGYRTIVWMIKWMIKAHPTENRMARRAWVHALFIRGSLVQPRPVRRP
jgi:hypothetical protein